MVNKIKWVEKDPEYYEIYVNNQYVMSVNHDSHGWRGIETAETLLRSISSITGMEFEEVIEQEAEDEPEEDLSETLYDRNGKTVIIGKDGKVVARQG